MKSKNAFTLIELLVVTAIVAVLIATLLPALAKAKYNATLLRCSAQQKQIGNGLMAYTNDNKTYWPARVGQSVSTFNLPNWIARRVGGVDYDDRIPIRAYFSTLNVYNCPFVPTAFDIDNYTLTNTNNIIQTPYSTFYGWRMDPATPSNIMAKQDSRLTYGGVRFNVLVADEERYTPVSNDLTTAHPDFGKLLEWRSATTPRSIFWTYGGLTRLPIQHNFLFDTGSVVQLKMVTNDPATSPIPIQLGQGYSVLQDYMRLPPETN